MIPIRLEDLSLTTHPWDADWIDGWLNWTPLTFDSVHRIGDGDFASRSQWRGRSVKITGLLHTRDCVEQQAEHDRLTRILSDGQPRTLTATHGDLELHGSFQVADRIVFDTPTPQIAEWELTLYSEDPFLYGRTESVTVAPAGDGVGLIYPLYAPDGEVSYGAESQATTGVLTNHGTVNAWPIYWPRGNMPTGYRIIQGGHVIEWSGAVRYGVPTAVDTRRSAVEITGTDVSHLLYRDDFQPVRPGESVSVTFEPLGGGTGYLEATLASTYL